MRKSLVLLKNGKSAYTGPIVPLPKKAPKILVAGTNADNLGYQCGGWTIEWQGLSGNNLTTGTYTLPMLYIVPLPPPPKPNGLLSQLGLCANYNEFHVMCMCVRSS